MSTPNLARLISLKDFNQICRTCLGDIKLNPIFETLIEERTTADVLNDCLALEVKRSDSMPHFICESCLFVLYRLHDFRRRCHENQVLLKSLLDFPPIVHCKIKDEVFVDEASVEENIPIVEALVKEEIPIIKTLREEEISTIEALVEEQIPTVEACKVEEESGGNIVLEASKKELKIEQRRKRDTEYKKQKWQCEICQKIITRPRRTQHLRNHANKKPFVCEWCGKGFNSTAYLKRHRMIHTKERPYSCSTCSMGFSRIDVCKLHEISHTRQRESRGVRLYKRITPGQHGEGKEKVKNFACDICERQFVNKAGVRQHLKSHKEKSFLCSYCGRGFTLKSQLNSHLRVHTKERPYTCQLCKKTFAYATVLSMHMLTHTGKRPHSCSICSKTFTQGSHLKRHLVVHTGERPHRCRFCGKGFADRGNLNGHVRTHTGEKPYECPTCGKEFAELTAMKKHRKRHILIGDDEKKQQSKDEIKSEV